MPTTTTWRGVTRYIYPVNNGKLPKKKVVHKFLSFWYDFCNMQDVYLRIWLDLKKNIVYLWWWCNHLWVVGDVRQITVVQIPIECGAWTLTWIVHLRHSSGILQKQRKWTYNILKQVLIMQWSFNSYPPKFTTPKPSSTLNTTTKETISLFCRISHLVDTINLYVKLNYAQVTRGGISINFFWGGEGGKKNFLGSTNVKNAGEACKDLPFLCWNCQIWANFNTFEMIFWGELEGQENIFGENAPHAPLWHHHCKSQYVIHLFS